MARPPYIELGAGRHTTRLTILYEDRSVIAIDKPAGWLLVPHSWQRTSRNLPAAITSSIAHGDFWARSRNLKFLRHVHRLDGDTSGVLLMVKSLGAVGSYGDLFESRQMTKTYLAVVHGQPKTAEWVCRASLGPDPQEIGRVVVDERQGKEAETSFRVVASAGQWSVVEARPYTGRTHQIRVHLLAAGHPVVGDELYGPDAGRPGEIGRRERADYPLGLRAVGLEYVDPFTKRPVRIAAPAEGFLATFGWETPLVIGQTGRRPPPAAPGMPAPSRTRQRSPKP
jgi:23S rRNA pseudouridine1911/1915/1917 synthase